MNISKMCRYGQMIYNQHDVDYAKHLDNYSEYMNNEISILPRLGFVVEIGANYGTHTLPLSYISKTVLAIEKDWNKLHCLCGNLAINNKTNVFTSQDFSGIRCDFIKISSAMDKEYYWYIEEKRPVAYIATNENYYFNLENYRFYLHLVRYYNPDNFSKNMSNLFGLQYKQNLLCVPNEKSDFVVGMEQHLDPLESGIYKHVNYSKIELENF